MSPTARSSFARFSSNWSFGWLLWVYFHACIVIRARCGSDPAEEEGLAQSRQGAKEEGNESREPMLCVSSPLCEILKEPARGDLQAGTATFPARAPRRFRTSRTFRCRAFRCRAFRLLLRAGSDRVAPFGKARRTRTRTSKTGQGMPGNPQPLANFVSAPSQWPGACV